MAYFAHTKGIDQNDWQLLKDHLVNTATLAAKFAEDFDAKEMAFTAGILHDLGKYSLAFQQRLNGSSRKTEHSSAGAKEITKIFENDTKTTLAQLVSYCIVGHHTGLPDHGSKLELEHNGTFLSRMRAICEDYSTYKDELDPSIFKLPQYINLRPIPGKWGFSAGFFTRMLYSALVDADYLDTEEFIKGKQRRGEYPSIEALTKKLNEHLVKFEHPTNAIDEQRTRTLKECIAAAENQKGLFTLTVPTGGGKTLSSLAFALNHAVSHGIKRVIYIIPFTSIIEQNAGIFKEILGEENVLEHHSNFDWNVENGVNEDDRIENETSRKTRLATETWDAPMIVTTNEQFFESLFSNKPSRCRKLHNIANSVLIFDEAQALPREFLTPAMDAVWELVTNYKASAVFCTATQPRLQTFLPAGLKIAEQASDPQKLFDFYKRVQLIHLGRVNDNDLIERMKTQQRSLCIVNTRKHAQGLVKVSGFENCYHLSTTMCAAHRQLVLKEIRNRLDRDEACRVISTQVIEAGVDIDFPVGFRALAGLDSIIQAAGRVNREGKKEKASVFVFEPDSIYAQKMPKFIEQGAALSKIVLRDHPDDPISIEAIEQYFRLLYSFQDGARAFDAKNILACFERSEGFDFATAAERFKIIENATKPVVIPFDEKAERMIAQLENDGDMRAILRKLQPYSVNLFEKEFDHLLEEGGIELVATTLAVLRKPEYYKDDIGIDILDLGSGNAVYY